MGCDAFVSKAKPDEPWCSAANEEFVLKYAAGTHTAAAGAVDVDDWWNFHVTADDTSGSHYSSLSTVLADVRGLCPVSCGVCDADAGGSPSGTAQVQAGLGFTETGANMAAGRCLVVHDYDGARIASAPLRPAHDTTPTEVKTEFTAAGEVDDFVGQAGEAKKRKIAAAFAAEAGVDVAAVKVTVVAARRARSRRLQESVRIIVTITMPASAASAVTTQLATKLATATKATDFLADAGVTVEEINVAPAMAEKPPVAKVDIRASGTVDKEGLKVMLSTAYESGVDGKSWVIESGDMTVNTNTDGSYVIEVRIVGEYSTELTACEINGFWWADDENTDMFKRLAAMETTGVVTEVITCVGPSGAGCSESKKCD